MTWKNVNALLITMLLLAAAGCNSDRAVKGASPVVGKTENAAVQPNGVVNINDAKLQTLLDQGVTLVDIRLPEEWRQTGIVKGSKTITFFDRTGRINPDFVPQFTALVKPDQPVALICRTGNRTMAASDAIARQLGYKHVYNVKHGITGWLSEKRPVVKYQQ